MVRHRPGSLVKRSLLLPILRHQVHGGGKLLEVQVWHSVVGGNVGAFLALVILRSSFRTSVVDISRGKPRS